MRSLGFGKNGLVIGLGSSALYKSTNNGLTWQQIATLPQWQYSRILFDNRDYVYYKRPDGLYRSTDNGAIWSRITPETALQFKDFIISRTGSIIAGTSDGIYISTNGGTTWSAQKVAYNQNNIDMLFTAPNGQIFANTTYGLYSTFDGITWVFVDGLDSRGFSLMDLEIDSEGYLYASSSGKGVFRTPTPFLKILPPTASAQPGDQKAYLSWSKSSSANFQKYRIYGSYNHYPTVRIDSIISGVNDTTKIISGITNNTPYYIVVSAVDNLGNESFSEEIMVTPIPAPSKPQLYSIADTSVNTAINLSFMWSKGTYTNLYHFQLAADSLFASIITQDSLLTDSSKAVTGLSYSTKYYWRVRGKGITETGLWSDVRSFTTIIEKPTAAAALSPLNNTDNLDINMLFRWNPSLRVEHYHFQLSKNNGFSNFVVNDSTLTDTTLSQLLEHDVQYYWRVRAKNIGGISEWSEVWSFTTIVDTPAIPMLVYPSDSSVNVSANCILRWNRDRWAATYHLLVSTDSLFNELVINDSLITDTLKNIAPLIYDKKYFWKVKSKNIAGESEWTPVQSFTTVIAAPNTPYTYEPMDDSLNTPVTLVFKWQALADAETYHLQVSLSQDFNTIAFNDSALTDTLKEVSALQNNKMYYWRVRANNIGGNSVWSETWNFKTIVAIPASPVLVSPANGSKNQPKELQLTWNTVQDAETYRVLLYEDTTNITIDDSALSAGTKNVSGLKSGMKYYWRVNAKNIAGTGSYSSVWNFITILESPASLEAEQEGLRRIKLSWADNSDNESGFILERNTAEEAGYRIVDTVKADDTTYTDSTVTGETTYKYRIKSYTEYASSGYSNEAEIIVTGIINGGQTPTEYGLSQNYPNPFNPGTVIKYSLPFESHVNVTIYNSIGEIVKELVNGVQQAGYHQETWNASNLSSGIYFYSIKAQSTDGKQNFHSVRKMILMK